MPNEQTLRNLPFALIIMDGLGLNPDHRGNAVLQSGIPNLKKLMQQNSNSTLTTHGLRVGLPEGQMGNSEVGHLNIGAGRVVEQDLVRVSRVLQKRDNSFLPELERACATIRANPESAFHLLGLVSTGGVHSSLAHLKELMLFVLRAGVSQIFIHALTDGRDRPPRAAAEEFTLLDDFIQGECRRRFPDAQIGIATIIGRYYGMDRDHRWDRTEKAYRLLVDGSVEKFDTATQALLQQYNRGVTDEFIPPMSVRDGTFQRNPFFESQDTLLFFNFRADRMRQIVSAEECKESSLFLKFKISSERHPQRILTLTEYDPNFNLTALFPPLVIQNHFGQVVSFSGLRQLRVAETEKYAHVTYFFNGGVEQPCIGEQRILIPSPRDVPTYDLKPEMSAITVCDTLCNEISNGSFDVAIVNFANCDMVGHTGVFEAAVKAVDTVDACIGRVVREILARNGTAIVTADHGNAEQMVDYETGGPHTTHTTYPVPIIVVTPQGKKLQLREGGALCDIAPTACELIGIAKPKEMTGSSLFRE